MAVDFLVLGPTIGNAKVSMLQAIRPLGVHKVAWIARKHGYNALAISKLQILSEDEIVELCSKFVGPKTLIGISTSMLALPASGSPRQAATDFSVLYRFISAVTRIRQRYNNKLILGGQIAFKFQELFNADYVLNGLSVENEIAKFLDNHFRNGIQRKPYDWHITTCDFKWHETDFIQKNEALPIETSRGCIFKCKFCTFSEIGRKKGTFEKDMDGLKEYLIENYEKYNVTNYTLADDTFNDDDERMNEWCDMLETLPFKVRYGGYVRLDLLERYQNTAKRLYHNGLSGCSFGVETFHPKAAKIIGKSFSATKGKEFLDYLWETIFEKNVFIITTNIVGLPGEDFESLEETFKWYYDRPHLFILWSALFVSYDPKKLVAQTLFGEEPEKYGFTFPTDDPLEWHTDLMTFSQAKNKMLDLQMRGHRHYVDAWTQYSYFAVHKMEPRDYLQLNWHEKTLLHDKLQKDVDKINLDYFEALRRYGDSQ